MSPIILNEHTTPGAGPTWFSVRDSAGKQFLDRSLLLSSPVLYDPRGPERTGNLEVPVPQCFYNSTNVFGAKHDDFALAVSQFNPFFFHGLFHPVDCSIFVVD